MPSYIANSSQHISTQKPSLRQSKRLFQRVRSWSAKKKATAHANGGKLEFHDNRELWNVASTFV